MVANLHIYLTSRKWGFSGRKKKLNNINTHVHVHIHVHQFILVFEYVHCTYKNSRFNTIHSVPNVVATLTPILFMHKIINSIGLRGKTIKIMPGAN